MNIAEALHLSPDSTNEQVVGYLDWVQSRYSGEVAGICSALLVAMEDVRLEYMISQLPIPSVRYAGDGKNYYYHRTDGKYIGNGDNARAAIDSAREGQWEK